MLATKIPPLYWLARPESQEIGVHTMQDGTRVFPMFSQESYALDYQEAYRIPQSYIVWGNDTAEYVTRALDAFSGGFDVIMIDPPTTYGATAPFYTLEDMKAYIWRKAEEGAAW